MLSCSISARMWISFSMSFMATPLLDVSTRFFLMYFAAYSVLVDFSITRWTTANSPLKLSFSISCSLISQVIVTNYEDDKWQMEVYQYAITGLQFIFIKIPISI